MKELNNIVIFAINMFKHYVYKHEKRNNQYIVDWKIGTKESIGIKECQTGR
jgi:hypothetical protein